MSSGRQTVIGRTHACPHCKTTILDSAAVCPACQHYLRFDKGGLAQSRPMRPVFRVEGSFRQEPAAGAAEYCVVVVVRNDGGEEIARRVVDVGAMKAGESRSFQVSVEASTETPGPRPVR
jgi:hypothetical protein